MDSKFVEGFTKEAVAAGVPVEHVPALLDMSLTMELLTKDAAFREGFEAELEKAGQHFWKNLLSGAAIGAGAGTAVAPGAGTLLGGLGGAITGGYRGIKKNLNDPNNAMKVLERTHADQNRKMQTWQEQRQRLMTGMGGMGMGMGGMGGFPRPGFSGYGYGYGYGQPGGFGAGPSGYGQPPRRWVSGYGYRGW